MFVGALRRGAKDGATLQWEFIELRFSSPAHAAPGAASRALSTGMDVVITEGDHKTHIQTAEVHQTPNDIQWIVHSIDFPTAFGQEKHLPW